MAYAFRRGSKFALLAAKNIYTDLAASEFRLSDGTWVMTALPLPDLGIWQEWIGSIRVEQLKRTNLVLLVDKDSDNPEILDGVHQQLGRDLGCLFHLLHLKPGVECAEGADLLLGSCKDTAPAVRQISQLPKFHQTKGYRRAPVTLNWLEEAIALRSGVAAMEADKREYRRVILGLNVLFKGLKETGQERMHQFVRSLEALILPDTGKTRSQFVHRCQTFAQAGADSQTALQEAFDMRSDTEHLQDWNRAVQNYPASEREDVCWQRARQMERLACCAYSRLLLDANIREHFRTDASIGQFWKLADDQRRSLWGVGLNLSAEPRYTRYDNWGRAQS